MLSESLFVTLLFHFLEGTGTEAFLVAILFCFFSSSFSRYGWNVLLMLWCESCSFWCTAVYRSFLPDTNYTNVNNTGTAKRYSGRDVIKIFTTPPQTTLNTGVLSLISPFLKSEYTNMSWFPVGGSLLFGERVQAVCTWTDLLSLSLVFYEGYFLTVLSVGCVSETEEDPHVFL